MNFVTDPVEFDASLLPEQVKEQILNKIRGSIYLGCSDFYDTVEKHLQKSESLDDANEFLKLTEKMDKVRGQSLRDTFPEFELIVALSLRFIFPFIIRVVSLASIPIECVPELYSVSLL